MCILLQNLRFLNGNSERETGGGDLVSAIFTYRLLILLSRPYLHISPLDLNNVTPLK